MNIYNIRYKEEQVAQFDTICFAKIEINRIPGLMTDKKLNMDYVPDDVFAFEIGKNPDGSMVLSNFVDADFYGTFITKSDMGISDEIRSITFPYSSMAYLCHDAIFGKDYKQFFIECI